MNNWESEDKKLFRKMQGVLFRLNEEDRAIVEEALEVMLDIFNSGDQNRIAEIREILSKK